MLVKSVEYPCDECGFPFYIVGETVREKDSFGDYLKECHCISCGEVTKWYLREIPTLKDNGFSVVKIKAKTERFIKHVV